MNEKSRATEENVDVLELMVKAAEAKAEKGEKEAM